MSHDAIFGYLFRYFYLIATLIPSDKNGDGFVFQPKQSHDVKNSSQTHWLNFA